MHFSSRIQKVHESSTLAITAKAKQMKADGIDVVSFGAGEPDFGTPEHIGQAAIKAIEDGFTKYTPASGLPQLKNAICNKLSRDNELDYTPENIIVSCGAKHSIYNIITVLVEEGDEVVIVSPYWVSYPEQVVSAGATAVFVSTDESTGFKATPEQLKSAITPATKLVIINSPCNPTGAVYTPEELAAIGEVLKKNDVSIISDDIYEKLVYDGTAFVNILNVCPELKERTFIVNGVSKAYSMTGWRIGYVAGPAEAVKMMSRLQSHSTSNPTSIAQIASIAALEGDQSCVEEMRVEFEKRRNYIVERLNAIEGVRCLKPEGAFYVFPNVGAVYGTTIADEKVTESFSFAKVCLEKANIAVVPGAAFGDDDCIRLSYATGMKEIEKGMDRLEKLLS